MTKSGFIVGGVAGAAAVILIFAFVLMPAQEILTPDLIISNGHDVTKFGDETILSTKKSLTLVELFEKSESGVVRIDVDKINSSREAGTLGSGFVFDDFKKLDIRVGSILEVEKIPGKTRIIKGVVDLGEEKRDVIIGGAEFYEPQDLVGKTVIVIANLETKKIAGIESNAMLLAADVDNKPFWLTVDSNVPAGTKIK